MRAHALALVLVLLVMGLLISVNGVEYTCPGASAEASKPGTEDCSAPVCTHEIWQQNKLLPHENPLKFYQCGPGLNYYVMSCGLGTCFSPSHQVCVHAYQWKNPCKETVEIIPTTTEAPATTTTPETTTVTTEITTLPPTTEEITTEITTESTTPEPVQTTTTLEPETTPSPTEEPTTVIPTTTEEITTPTENSPWTTISTTDISEDSTTEEWTTIPPTESTEETITTTPAWTTTSASEQTSTESGEDSTLAPITTPEWITEETTVVTTEESGEANTPTTVPITSTEEVSTEITTEMPRSPTTDSGESTEILTSPSTTTKTPFTGQICPGSDPEFVEAGDQQCVTPKCTTELQGQKFPDANPRYYYVCRNGAAYGYILCPANRCFSVQANDCVDANVWVNSCTG